MLNHLLSRAFLRPYSAAADLYFTNAMQDVAGWRRLSTTVFDSDAAVLVIRNHLGARLDLAGRHLIYLIDDDLAAAIRDPGLAAGYRFRLAVVEGLTARRALGKSPILVATSAPLCADLARRSGRAVDRLWPYWSDAFSTLDHFGPDAPPRVGYLGSKTHRGDLPLAMEVLRLIADARPGVEIVLAANHERPDWLASYPHLRLIEATRWGDYRQAVSRIGCQVLIYPMRDNRLNRARSPNKLIEHGIAGGAALYPTHWPEAAEVEHGASGLVLPDDPERWAAEAVALLDDRSRARNMAEGGQALARRLNDPQPLRAYWREKMGLS
ncbi:MAG: hypothetical protein AAF415_10765 [Pseudomonadota bacterium]